MNDPTPPNVASSAWPPPDEPPATRRRTVCEYSPEVDPGPGQRHPSLDPGYRYIAPPTTGLEADPYFAGYLSQMSLVAGDPLTVHVASRADTPCNVDIYRVLGCADPALTPRLEHVVRLGSVEPVRYPKTTPGRRLAPGDCDVSGCCWRGHTILDVVPRNWRSGLYLAQFTASDVPTGRAGPRLGEDALFVVRPSIPGNHSKLLFQIGVATWAAYHMWGNRSLYMGRTERGERVDELRAYRASLERPGVGLGLPNATILTPAPPKAAYAFAFIDWLTKEGITVEYCSGLDISAGRIPLDAYTAVITIGHDEYWTASQRRALQEFRREGGHTLFFGGNLAYWQIRAVGDDSAILCYKRSAETECPGGEPGEPLDPRFSADAPGDCEVTTETWSVEASSTIPLTGVYNITRRPSSRDELVFGGGLWYWEEGGGPSRPALGFTVVRPEHWVFGSINIAEGDTFGAASKLIGHEADGLELDLSQGVPRLSASDGALPGTELLAFADCRDWGKVDYGAWPPIRRGFQRSSGSLGGCVTMIYRQEGSEGMLFSAPTNEWVFGLVMSLDWTATRALEATFLEPDPVVAQVTRNVLRAAAVLRPPAQESL